MEPNQTQRKITEIITGINAVGLREAWFSWDKSATEELAVWLVNQGYRIREEQWNHPESLYVGNPNTAPRTPVVYSVKW